MFTHKCYILKIKTNILLYYKNMIREEHDEYGIFEELRGWWLFGVLLCYEIHLNLRILTYLIHNVLSYKTLVANSSRIRYTSLNLLYNTMYNLYIYFNKNISTKNTYAIKFLFHVIVEVSTKKTTGNTYLIFIISPSVNG